MQFSSMRDANCFAKYPTEGTRYLILRDVPALINKHITGKKALDYGCGTGHTTALLKSCGLIAEGVDISQNMLVKAQERDPEGTYVLIESAKIPRPNEHYDFVCVALVLAFVSTKSEIIRILKEIARVLKSGGTVMIIDPSEHCYTKKFTTVGNDFGENKSLASGSTKKLHLQSIDLTVTTYYWSEEDYRECFVAAGLTLVDIHRPIGYPSDGIEWKDEALVSPCDIYIAKI